MEGKGKNALLLFQMKGGYVRTECDKWNRDGCKMAFPLTQVKYVQEKSITDVARSSKTAFWHRTQSYTTGYR